MRQSNANGRPLEGAIKAHYFQYHVTSAKLNKSVYRKKEQKYNGEPSPEFEYLSLRYHPVGIQIQMPCIHHLRRRDE